LGGSSVCIKIENQGEIIAKKMLFNTPFLKITFSKHRYVTRQDRIYFFDMQAKRASNCKIKTYAIDIMNRRYQPHHVLSMRQIEVLCQRRKIQLLDEIKI